MAGEMKESPRNMGSRRLFGSFLAAQKGTQPVKSVDHKTRHSFIGAMNKVTRRQNPRTTKTAFIMIIDSLAVTKTQAEKSYLQAPNSELS
jgi:hypothetical protein